MKILLTKTSDWSYNKIIEINDLMELKDIYHAFVINFKPDKYDIKQYGEFELEAEIYDSWRE